MCSRNSSPESESVTSAKSQLKTAGTQKCSPFPPLRTPSYPLPKNKECYSSLGGDRGHPFAQHCSCPAILRCSVGFTKAAFLGTLIGVGKMVASIAQGTSPCAQSARRQRPCCRLFRRCVSSSKMNMPLTQVALVARPCAPDAQRVEDSSSSRSRLAKSYGRFAPLDLRQACFFRVYLPKQHSSYSPPAADKLITSAHPFIEKLRSDSFQKLRMLRNRLNLISVFTPQTTDFENPIV